HQFPFKLSHRVSGRLVHQVEIIELTDAPDLPPEFDPPDGAQWMNWCADEQIPKRQKGPALLPIPQPPQFHAGAPPLAVVVYGVVGGEGGWENVTILKSEGEPVDSYFLKNLNRQTLQPPLCDGRPVESEEILEFEYP